MDWATIGTSFLVSLAGGGLISAIVALLVARHQIKRANTQDYFSSFEKQIESVEKRGDGTESSRLRQTYEREQEAWRAQQDLEISAPREISREQVGVTTDELDKLTQLLVQAANAPVATLTPESHLLRGHVYYRINDLHAAIEEYTFAINQKPRGYFSLKTFG